METLMIRFLRFVQDSATTALLKLTPKLSWDPTRLALERQMDISKRKLEMSGIDTRPNWAYEPLLQATYPAWSYIPPQTRTVSNNTQTVSWQYQQYPNTLPVISPLTNLPAVSADLTSLRSQHVRELAKQIGLLVQLERSVKRVRKSCSLAQKCPSTKYGSGIGQLSKTMESLQTTVSMYATTLRQMQKELKKR